MDARGTALRDEVLRWLHDLEFWLSELIPWLFEVITIVHGIGIKFLTVLFLVSVLIASVASVIWVGHRFVRRFLTSMQRRRGENLPPVVGEEEAGEDQSESPAPRVTPVEREPAASPRVELQGFAAADDLARLS